MSKKKEIPVQFYLPIGGGLVNQCCFVSEDELEEKDPAARLPALLDRAEAGELSARTLSRFREELLREAVRADRAEALSRLLPKKRMEPQRFSALFSYAESCSSPAAAAVLLAYRRAHYTTAEFEALEQRALDRELGLLEPDESELRRLFRLRYLKEGVCICGVRETQQSYEIPAAIGGRAVVGVDAAAFYTPDVMPRVSRAFAADNGAAPAEGDRFLLGRAMERRGCAETPLAWRVVRREEGRALAVCERAVAVLPYNGELREVTWENCDLRRWLNGVFLSLCFTPAERESILPAAVETPDNYNFGTPGGAATEDFLFLPSVEEAFAFFETDAARALGQWWWLRTPGFDNTFAAAVTPNGAVVKIGSFVDTDDYAVRPAMWVKI